MGFNPFSNTLTLGLLATTGLAGFALQNATPNILTWTAPNDGNMHRVVVVSTLIVTSAETGGEITVNYTDPSNVARQRLLYAAALGTGISTPAGNTPTLINVYPGTTVVVQQFTALSAGAAGLWAELWGS
jgi:hypothetical protein